MKEKKIEFYSMGQRIAGTMYFPDTYQAGGKLPCVIPNSGFTGINAVYPALFARFLTKRGYICIGFDYRGWAPSAGTAGLTTAAMQYEDITAAYVFAAQQPEIDAENIGLFGWGFAAHNVIRIAADNPEIKAVGCGNGFYNFKNMFRTSCPYEEYLSKMEEARQDRIKRVLTGEGDNVNCYTFSGTGDGGRGNYVEGTLKRLTPDMEEILIRDYGSVEAFPPNQSWEYFDSCLRVNALEYVEKLAFRGLFLGGSIHDVVYPFCDTEEIYAAAGVGKVLYPVDGGHNDWMFDDDPRFVAFADALASFYDTYLK